MIVKYTYVTNFDGNFCVIRICEATKPPYSSVTASDYRSKDGLVSELAELVVRCWALPIHMKQCQVEVQENYFCT